LGRKLMGDRGPAFTIYSVVGLVALALLLAGITGDTSDTGNGIGMAVFGALFLSASVSGLLGALAGSRGHVWWALAGFFLPGYSLPFVLYYGLKGREERKRWKPAPPRAAATEVATNVATDLSEFDVNKPLPRWEPSPGTERDPERIDVLIEQLRRCWKQHPHQRLGQLLCNLVGPKPNPLFYVEDHVVSERLLDRGASQVWPHVHADPPAVAPGG